MAVNMPNSARRQPDEGLSMDADGALEASFAWRGPYAALAAAAAAIKPGDAMPSDPGSGWRVSGWNLRRIDADYGDLTIRCGGSDSAASGESGTSTTPFRTVYSVKSVRNDVSILAYCGTSANNPNRPAIERWMREPDTALANDYKYTDRQGNIVDISDDPEISYSVPVIDKIRKGIERVIRFYPQLTIKRSFYAPPANDFGTLAHVDTPPTPSGENVLHPSGISSLISDYEWLKVQDDCDEQQDRTWMRVESWIGVLKTDSPDTTPWDRNLYGDGSDRWAMPANAPAAWQAPAEEAS